MQQALLASVKKILDDVSSYVPTMHAMQAVKTHPMKTELDMLKAQELYETSPFESILISSLTLALSKIHTIPAHRIGSCFSLLDVGCGKLKTMRNMIAGPMGCMSGVVKYTSVDRIVTKEMVDEILQLGFTHSPLVSSHHCLDIFESELVGEVNHTYDIVVIDIEPHGREIEVYERIRHHMKATHVCLLKHVGYVDLFGSKFADQFLHKYLTERCVLDYFALHDSHFRDVILVMTKEDTDTKLVSQGVHTLTSAHASNRSMQVINWCEGSAGYVWC